jgi:hypothetical protein
MNSRNCRASAIAEFPVAMGIFLLVIFFPLLDLATIYMGVQAVHSAARVAAVQGAKQNTYQQMQSVAQGTANSASNNNVSIGNVVVTFYRTQFAPDPTADPPQTTMPANATPQVIDPSQGGVEVNTYAYIYQVQVTATGSVSGLVMMSPDVFGKVPGLTVPIPVTATSTATLEYPKGLNS